MTDLLIGTIGGLVGSIITTLATKLIDFFQARSHQRHELRKLFFEKKLQVAGEAMSRYTNFATSMLSIKILFDRVLNDSTEMEEQLQATLVQQIQTASERAQDEKLNGADALELYFDLNMGDSDSILTNTFNVLGSGGPIMERLSLARAALIHAAPGIDREEASKRFLAAETDLRELTGRISAQYKLHKEKVEGIKQQLRTAMKKFDVK